MLEVSLFWFFIGVSFVVLGASYKTMTVSPAPLPRKAIEESTATLKSGA